jgi:hypothetical protein
MSPEPTHVLIYHPMRMRDSAKTIVVIVGISKWRSDWHSIVSNFEIAMVVDLWEASGLASRSWAEDVDALSRKSNQGVESFVLYLRVGIA